MLTNLYQALPSLSLQAPEAWLPYISAFLVGLVGGVHCLGMCGGIVSSLTLSAPQHVRHSAWGMLPYHLGYNAGRIISYVMAGALMGGLASLLLNWLPLAATQRILLVFAGLMMVLLGLYIAGWWMLLSKVERLGGGLWRRIEPIARTLLPLKSPAHSILVGLLWGWLPCGLVYSMLINAVGTGSALGGAGLMLAFALGTLPNLLIMGFLTGAAAHWLQQPSLRKLAGGMIILFGLWSLFRAI